MTPASTAISRSAQARISSRTGLLLGMLLVAPFGAAQTPTSAAWRTVLDAPTPRESYMMTYDSTRDVVVLFGGWDGSTLRNDTWEWSDGVWSLKSTTGPSIRLEGGFDFHSARGV
jgi:hypothetical protein